MNHTIIAQKTKAQFANFLGKVFAHFSKPTRRFIGAKCSMVFKPRVIPN